MEQLRLYTDGGVIGKNPSAIGGTWAWCLVSPANQSRVNENCGTVLAGYLGLPTISNNVTELLAAVLGLEWLPGNMNVHLFTDSNVTLLRLTTGKGWKGVPEVLKARALAVRPRVASATLLGGHPNKKELATGVRKDGFPVSIHNVYCDKLCNELAKKAKATAA